MMKNYIFQKLTFLTALLVLMSVYSCGNWLDVNPRTAKPTDKFFETQEGFQDALIGVYIKMKEVKAYGKSLTMSDVEQLVSFYDVPNNTSEYFLSHHQYTSTGAVIIIEGMYASLYEIIANTNNILTYIDNNKQVFKSQQIYQIVKGEALAIRAMCHLDLLRLFGPQPSKATDSPILSYVTTVGTDINPHVSFNTYVEHLKQDLTQAQQLLQKVDPIVGDGTSSDNFLNNRPIRFNYYGVKALEARAELYVGDKTAAVAAAREVVDSEKFRLGTLTDYSNNDMTLSPEQIVALQDFKLADRYKTTFYFNSGLHKGSGYDPVRKDIYENSASDIRVPSNVGPWDLLLTSKILITKKYDPELKVIGRIPLLRVAEMYLIIAEAAPLDVAQKYWTLFCKSRGIPETELAEATRKNIIMKEYRKEFYAEGQMFYCHKRMNSPKQDILWFDAASEVNYVLPIPITDVK